MNRGINLDLQALDLGPLLITLSLLDLLIIDSLHEERFVHVVAFGESGSLGFLRTWHILIVHAHHLLVAQLRFEAGAKVIMLDGLVVHTSVEGKVFVG